MFVYQAQVVGSFLFILLANWFLLYCNNLAVFIFPMLLADIQRPNWKFAQSGPHPEWLKLLIAYALSIILLDF